MKKLTINQILGEINYRLNHLKRLLNSCETRCQLANVDNYYSELNRQLSHIIHNNRPFFRYSKYIDDTTQLMIYFEDEYQKEYTRVCSKIY